MVLPVFISHSGNRSSEVLIHTLMDTQLRILVISTSICEKLQVTGETTELKLSTISAKNEVSQCQIITDLIVRAPTTPM